MKIILMLLLVSLACCTVAGEYPKRVSPYVIHDGDTFIVAKGNIVYRLWGVDAPEEGQPWADVARLALQTMIRKRIITLQSYHGDTYGRPVVLATVRGKDVGLELLKMGLAWHDTRFAPDKKEYAEAMAQAQKDGRGLWSDKKPVPPWEYRAQKKIIIIDEEPQENKE